MATDINNLLTTPIADTALSKELKDHFQKHKYNNLQEILRYEISVHKNQPSFTWHMLQDFLEYLKANNLAHLLKE